MPLLIIIKSNKVPCHFVSTGYVDSTLEYPFVKVLHTNNSALRNKTYSGKKLLMATWGGGWVVTWNQWHK
jgi:hypothetical protein